MGVCIVQPSLNAVSETFIRAHAEHLPCPVAVVHGSNPPCIGERALLSRSLFARACRKAWRIATRRPWEWQFTVAYLRAFRRLKPAAVLAEYGTTGVRVMEACKVASVPLVVHFHGFDASNRDVIAKFGEAYRAMFGQASAVIAVSRAMKRRLLALGGMRDRVYWNPYGVDLVQFQGAAPERAGPVFLAVGRFVEKKAPHLTLRAFAHVHRLCPEARLRMIGEGPLLEACKVQARLLGIEDAVAFLGAQAHEVVRKEMQNVRAFVQHSVEAANGDSEGTPVAILEAQATGLPVVSTRHAGIPDVVVEGQTGLLVNEGDIEGMGTQMLRLARDRQLAADLGWAARQRIKSHFSMEASIARLWKIIQGAINGNLPEPPSVEPMVECASGSAPSVVPEPRRPGDVKDRA